MTDTQGQILPVSVVIPFRNRPHLLARALLSVLRQDRPAAEIVLVDDRSTEDMGSLRAFAEAAGARWVSNHGGEGAAAARNLGVESASQPWVAFLDSDDYWLPSRLARSPAVTSMPLGVGVAACGVMFTKSDRIFRHTVPSKDVSLPLSDYLYRDGGLSQTSCLVIRKDLLSAEGFDESLPIHQETDLMLRLEAAGVGIEVSSDPLVVMDANPRPDRITLADRTSEHSLSWFETNAGDWSQEARRGFRRVDLAQRFAAEGRVYKALSAYLRSGGRIRAKSVARLVMVGIWGPRIAESALHRLRDLRGSAAMITDADGERWIADRMATDTVLGARIAAGETVDWNLRNVE